ncbi:MAG: hypothetical protein Q7J98_12805, partial [Kiritimatiellia bacterium]|nr:hypothetical protein [Kiritimatiellia bacterium]
LDGYFDVLWVFLGSQGADLLQPISHQDNCVFADDLTDLYQYFLNTFGLQASEAVVLPSRHELDAPEDLNRRGIYGWDKDHCVFPVKPYKADYPVYQGLVHKAERIDGGLTWGEPRIPGFFGRCHFYLWPEVYFRKALGVTDGEDLGMFAETFGIRTFHTVHARVAAPAGTTVNIVDETGPGDRAWDITFRVFERWRSEARGMGYSIHRVGVNWMGWIIRNRYFMLYDPLWEVYLPKTVGLANELGSRYILADADEWNHDFWPFMCVMNAVTLMTPAQMRVPSIKRGMRYAARPPRALPWALEYTDDELRRFARENRIAASLLWCTTEISYAEAFPVLADIFKTFQGRCGFGVHISWLEYFPEWLQQLYTEDYGRYIEPMLHYWGMHYNFPCDNMLPGFTPADVEINMRTALGYWERRLGKATLPRGYLSSQHERMCFGAPSGEERKFKFRSMHSDRTYDLLEEHGLRQAYRDFAAGGYRDAVRAKARVVKSLGMTYYLGEEETWTEEDGFVHLAARGYSTSLDKAKEIENAHPGPGYFLFKNDCGLTFCPQIAFYVNVKKSGYPGPSYTVDRKMEVVKYFAEGGDSGRFFPAKPHEVVRYLRILREDGYSEVNGSGFFERADGTKGKAK